MSKKGFVFPNALVIVFGIMVLAVLLTWAIPSGRYELLAGTKTLNPASYHLVTATPVSAWGLVDAVYAGMQKAAPIIIFTFLIGGYFNVLIESKAVDAFIGMLIARLGGNALVILPVLAFIMAVLGATGVMANPVVAVIPIGLVLAKRLHTDRLVALGVMYVAAYCGYATSPICAMTVQIAQKIAEVPMLSGFEFRSCVWLLFFVPTVLYLMHYARKVQRDPQASLLNEAEAFDYSQEEQEHFSFELSHLLALLGLVVGLGIYSYGSLRYAWGMRQMADTMLLVAIFVALVTRMGTNGFLRAFLKGAQQMTFSAILIGLATSISVILMQGNILHTIIYFTANFLQTLPQLLIAPCIFLFNLFFNFFVSSGSGQAAVVMPILAPLADVVGVERQVVILAYQLGDGLSNTVFPTNGTMMASIALAGVSFNKWLRWMLPLFYLWVGMGVLVTILAVNVGLK